MGQTERRLPILVVALLLLVVSCLGSVAAFFSIRSTVRQQFGAPSASLSLVQRVAFPLEMFFNRRDLQTPSDPLGDAREFHIDPGESVAMICIRLETEGILLDAELFRIYLIYTGMDRQLKSGRFTLSPAMTPVQVAAELLEAEPTDAVVTVLAGWRIEEVAASLPASGLTIAPESFELAAYVPEPAHVDRLPVENAPTLEGFLFPGTYVFPRDTGLETLLGILLDAFSGQVDQNLQEGYARQGLTVYEGLRLASIVEKEAVLAEEKPLIASVFLNRLRSGMRLETDPTVQYALGWQEDLATWWKSPLSGSDLTVESAYNTYIVFGLPPTPICNPDYSSLQAVAFPAETPYFFFRAACDGSGRHQFAITYEEHLDNACND